MIRFYPVKADEISKRLLEIVKAENLQEIISEKQVAKIAEAANGDVRKAIKDLQALCSGQTAPLTNSELDDFLAEAEP